MTGKRKVVITFCAAVPIAVICGLGLWGRFGSRPPVFDVNSPEKTVEYLASEEFVKMDMADKRQYIEEIRQSYSETPMLTLEDILAAKPGAYSPISGPIHASAPSQAYSGVDKKDGGAGIIIYKLTYYDGSL